MGNTESNESNTAGSSEEDSARRRRENIAAAVDAATTVAAVVAAGWAAAKLLSSSASEDENTNERGKMMEAAGSSRGGYPIPNQAAGRFESHQIPRIKFEDFPSDSVVLEGAAGTGNRIPGKLTPWSFPRRGKRKMNIDGSVNPDPVGYGGVGQAGFGGVIRDEGGALVMGFYGRLMDCSILEAELRAIYRGLRTIQDHDLSKVEEIESDSVAAVYHINNDTSANFPSAIKSIIEECKGMLLRRGCTLRQIPREGNRVADELAKLGRNQERDFVSVDTSTPPEKIKRLLDEDFASACSHAEECVRAGSASSLLRWK